MRRGMYHFKGGDDPLGSPYGSLRMKGLKEERLAQLEELYPTWEKKTVWNFFLATAKRVPDQDFIVTQDEGTYTYEQTRQETLRVARALVALGVRPGDHVAVQIGNSPIEVFIALALSAVRAVKVAVNAALGPKELGYILSQSRSRFFLAGRPVRRSGVETALEGVVALPGIGCETDIPVTAWADFLSAGAGAQLPESQGEQYADEICDIIYTSGSTSAPKGVLLTHDMLMRSAFASCINRGFERGRRVFVPLPMIHCYGYVEGLLACILVGGAVLFHSGKFRAQPALQFMLQSGANDILSVPSQMMAIIHYLEENPMELPQLHAVYCSAAVCPAWVWPGIREALKISDLITGYGMSEVCGASMQTRPTDSDDILRSRVGRLLQGGCAGAPEYGGCQLEYQVTDQQTGLPCKPGEPGELWCRGLVVTKGYYERPEINARAFTPDGWFRTGDCGYFDSEGYLVLCGRVDDMYKINGENVSPKFLEDVMGNCPLVNNAEVVGIRDDRHGYVGTAFIQLHEDTPEHRAGVEEYCREHLARFQVPKYFVYLKEGEWPCTSTGKIQKFRLRQMAEEMFGVPQ